MKMQTINLNTEITEIRQTSTDSSLDKLIKAIELAMVKRGKRFRDNLSNGDIVKIRTGKNRAIAEVVVLAIGDVSVFVKSKDGSKIGRSEVKEVPFSDIIQ